MPEEAKIGIGGLLLVIDQEEDPVWYTETARKEIHHITVTAHVPSAPSPVLPGQPPPVVPAERLMDVVESVLNWQDILDAVLGTTLLRVQRGERQRETVTQRDDQAQRVQKVSVKWMIEAGVDTGA